MEVNQPKSDYLAPASPYAREYLQELPSLRIVHPDSELGDNEGGKIAHETDGVISDARGSLLAPTVLRQRSSGSQELEATQFEQASFEA